MLNKVVMGAAAAAVLSVVPVAGSAQQNPVAGTWSGLVMLNGMQCSVDSVILADGTYSSAQRCGALTTSQRGTYKLFPNHIIGFNVLEWLPRRRYIVDAQPGTGHYEENAKPPGGMFRYAFTSPNKLVMRDVNYGGTITYHRVH